MRVPSSHCALAPPPPARPPRPSRVTSGPAPARPAPSALRSPPLAVREALRLSRCLRGCSPPRLPRLRRRHGRGHPGVAYRAGPEPQSSPQPPASGRHRKRLAGHSGVAGPQFSPSCSRRGSWRSGGGQERGVAVPRVGERAGTPICACAGHIAAALTPLPPPAPCPTRAGF